MGLLGTFLTPITGLMSPALANGLDQYAKANEMLAQIPDMCRVTTAAVEGPYYIDERIVRSDIREDQPGVPLELELQLVNANASCAPIEGAVISIWHCNAEGEYSGYLFNDPNTVPDLTSLDATGHVKTGDEERFLRGAQTTNAEGKVTFKTIVPGWYTPRAVHIHLRAFLSPSEMITTQLYFPQALLNVIQSTDPAYKDRGVSIFTNEEDLVRAQAGVSGMEDVLKVTVREDGSLFASMVLGAGSV